MNHAIRALLIALVPFVLRAQTLGVPMLHHPVMRGFGFAFDAAIDDSGVPAFAATVGTVLGHVPATITRDDGTIDTTRLPLLNLSATVTRLGGRTRGNVVGLELTLLSSLGIGVHRSDWQGSRRLYVPLAVIIPGMVCANRSKVLAMSVVPTWSFERIDGPASWQRSWSSLSVVAMLEFRSGLGFQLAVGDPAHDVASDPYRRSVISLGIHWSPHSIVESAGTTFPAGKMHCGFL